MKSWKDNISFVLVEPGEPGNIGAAARALKNMGFGNLELVKPGEFLTGEAKSMACSGGDILRKARVWPRLGEALKEDRELIPFVVPGK